MFDADQDYAEACHPDKWTILGVRLCDFCRGHRHILKRIGSPFVCEGTMTGAAFATALLVCSKTYEEGSKFIAGKPSFKDRALVRFIAIAEKLFPSFVITRAEALSKYMEEADRLPRGIFWNQSKPDGKKPETTYAPSALIFESDLANHYHLSISEILNMPMRKATFLRYRLLEMDGVLYWRKGWYGQPKQPEVSNGK